MVLPPSPVSKDGYIDEKVVFQLAYCTLGLPLNSLDDLSPLELSWLSDGHQDNLMDHYESIAWAVRVGYVTANNGKKIQMFDRGDSGDKQATNRITKEQKEKELSELDKIFEG